MLDSSGNRIKYTATFIKTTWKRKIPKYRYHENWNRNKDNFYL